VTDDRPLQRFIDAERAGIVLPDPADVARQAREWDRRVREGLSRARMREDQRRDLEAAPKTAVSEGAPVAEVLGPKGKRYCRDFLERVEVADYPGAAVHEGLAGVDFFGEDAFARAGLKRIRPPKAQRRKLRELGVRRYHLSRVGYRIGIAVKREGDASGLAVYLCADARLRDASGRPTSSPVRIGYPRGSRTEHFLQHKSGYWGDTLGTSGQWFDTSVYGTRVVPLFDEVPLPRMLAQLLLAVESGAAV
jgi:hypothetical protein